MKYLAPFGEFLGIPILVSLLWIILLFVLSLRNLFIHRQVFYRLTHGKKILL